MIRSVSWSIPLTTSALRYYKAVGTAVEESRNVLSSMVTGTKVAQ